MRRLFVCFLNFFFCRIFQFSRLGVVNLQCESTIILSAATVVAPYWVPTTAPMQMLVWWKNLDDETVPEKYFAFEPRTGTKCQLHSQGKITRPGRENRKMRHENEI
jgi:hypothetical protein